MRTSKAFTSITLVTDVSFSSSIAPICLPLGAGVVYENKYDMPKHYSTVVTDVSSSSIVPSVYPWG